ncbi:MAG: CRISPR system precrRNA processing endoribonuclease RAMP protein Cas6 [Lachnospiraceae bacterium]|nr:CRISPR system precrRNA processing endoribonuclease RAMP protein Cas6 [Lachnospiraceae bacterium]
MDNRELTEKCLHIRYTKLYFELTFPEDCVLPAFKSSALRGGMGEMLLRANCVRDRDCDHCDFCSECIVQRTMYSQFREKPAFITSGDSVGYVLNCEDYREEYTAGSTLDFTLTLFGSTIVYFNQYIQALYALGASGLGKEKARFYISNVYNSQRKKILDGNTVYMGNYRIETVAEYVHRRMDRLSGSRGPWELRFSTPLTQKYQGVFLKEFDMEAIVKSIQRRILILDAFEGFDGEVFYRMELPAPEIQDQQVRPISVKRYSNRKHSSMPLSGIKGSIFLDEIPESLLPVLLAGELLHIGKNTSFGYGGYRLQQAGTREKGRE